MRTHLKHRHRPRPNQIARPHRTPVPRLVRHQLPVGPVRLPVLSLADLERPVAASRPQVDRAAQIDAGKVVGGRGVLGEVVDEGQARRHLAGRAGRRQRVERHDPRGDGDAAGFAQEGPRGPGGFGGLDVAGWAAGDTLVAVESVPAKILTEGERNKKRCARRQLSELRTVWRIVTL